MLDSISLFLVHSQLPNTVKNKVCFHTNEDTFVQLFRYQECVCSEEWQTQTMTACISEVLPYWYTLFEWHIPIQL